MSRVWARPVATAIAIAAALTVAVPAAAGTVRYRILDLGVLGNDPDAYSVGRALNNEGQVVGDAPGPDRGIRAFRTRPNSPMRVEDILDPGPGESIGFGVNDLGQAAGYTDLDNPFFAFRTAPNAPVNRATDNIAPPSSPALVRGMNNSGQVVGGLGRSDQPSRAFRTRPNAAIDPVADDLGTLGGASSFANGINDAGVAVGNAERADGRSHAFRVLAGRTIDPATDDLGTLGGDSSGATDINEAGRVVGRSSTGAGADHAFRTAPGAAINPETDDLGVLAGTTASIANSINARGDVVGRSYTPGLPSNSFDSRAFLFRDGELLDLNDLLDTGGATVWLYEATAINDRGQIVANALFDNRLGNPGRAVLLTPTVIPVPPALLPGAAGLAGIIAARLLNRRRAARS
jgi:probable HAF family extracellular repeat protein